MEAHPLSQLPLMPDLMLVIRAAWREYVAEQEAQLKERRRQLLQALMEM